jgi:stage III sporulation protein AD
MSTTQVLTLSVGVLLCGAMLAVVLRSWRPELALCLSLAAGVVVLILLLGQIAPLLAAVKRLTAAGGLSTDHLTVVLKAAGICLLTQLTADTCRDAGESSLAGKAELVGRVLLLLLAVPLFEEILALVTGLLQGQVIGG